MTKQCAKVYGLIIFASIIFILIVQNAAAFGVTAPYWQENPLLLQPGDTRTITFSLQNMVGDEEVSVSVEVIKDKSYIQHTGSSNRYTVPPQTKDIQVPFEIKIPTNTKMGSKLPVEISFLTTAEGSSGKLALGVGVTKVFDIIVGAESQKQEEPQAVPAPQKEEKTSMIRPLTKDDIIPALLTVIIILIFWLLIQRLRLKKLKGNKQESRSGKEEHARW